MPRAIGQGGIGGFLARGARFAHAIEQPSQPDLCGESNHRVRLIGSDLPVLQILYENHRPAFFQNSGKLGACLVMIWAPMKSLRDDYKVCPTVWDCGILKRPVFDSCILHSNFFGPYFSHTLAGFYSSQPRYARCPVRMR